MKKLPRHRGKGEEGNYTAHFNTFHGIDAGQHSHRKSAERQLCQQETLQHRVESRWSQYAPPAAVPA